jgi:hypothetical protein
MAKRAKGESAQVIVMIALAAIVMFGITGLAIDVGRLYLTKAELSRAVDAAALAGVLELNGTPAGQTAACTKATAFMAANEPAVTPTCSVPGANQLQISGAKTVNTFFLSVLGVYSANVSAYAKAGFGIQPIDVFLAIDATSSMGYPNGGCTSSSNNNSGCAIWEAKSAAKTFTETLIGSTPSGYTQVGAGAFRGCYNLPRTLTACVRAETQATNPGVFRLTTNKTTLKANIDTIGTTAGTGTNVCLGLHKAREMLLPPPDGNSGNNAQTASNTRRFLVILSDGDNVYNDTNYISGTPGHPPIECQPSGPNQDNGYTASVGCGTTNNSNNKGLQVDVKTRDLAQALKAAGIEIYVVAFGVCSNSQNNQCSTSEYNAIGNTDSNNTADKRLLVCVASNNTVGDHYFYAATAAELPAVFTQIAQQIAHRLIE